MYSLYAENPLFQDADPWQVLGYAVVLRAAEDWSVAWQKMQRNPEAPDIKDYVAEKYLDGTYHLSYVPGYKRYSEATRRWKTAKKTLAEVEDFFSGPRSRYFTQNGPYILRMLKKEAG